MTEIPCLNATLLAERDPDEIAQLRHAAETVGFATVAGTQLTAERIKRVLGIYRQFFTQPVAAKTVVDMARTGANRGWGAPGAEQVNPEANPDYKEVFDCGHDLPRDHPLAQHAVYAPNQWPNLPGFQDEITAYFADACTVAMDVLRALAVALDEPADSFETAFDPPMALLRGNYYPERPASAGEHDFGIAAHTDYGCLTLLATDGEPGLEVQGRAGAWVPVVAEPGVFVINFGEMMEMWSAGRVKATPHRVIGGTRERLSVPLFFNPAWDADVSAPGSDVAVPAGPYLAQRFEDTYLHLQDAD